MRRIIALAILSLLFVGISASALSLFARPPKLVMTCEGAQDVERVGRVLYLTGKQLHRTVDTMLGHAMADRIIDISRHLESVLIEFEELQGHKCSKV